VKVSFIQFVTYIICQYALFGLICVIWQGRCYQPVADMGLFSLTWTHPGHFIVNSKPTGESGIEKTNW
jgi:hypothetical protein